MHIELCDRPQVKIKHQNSHPYALFDAFSTKALALLA